MTEPLLETISLDLEESNELLFKVGIEGTETPAKVRLVVEGDVVSYMFDGYPTEQDGHVLFTIPRMDGKLDEETYVSRVEVLVENRYFAPVQFGVEFKKAVKVVAEVVSVPKKRAKAADIQVTAAPVVVKKPKPKRKATQRPAVIEKPKRGSLAERYQYRRKSKK